MIANSDLDFSGAVPAGISPRQKLGQAIQHASLAVTMEEWQPWQFFLADGHVELYTRTGRYLPSEDFLEREILIHCGTVLQRLKLALKHLGCLGRVELFPDLAQPGLVARVHHGSSQKGDKLDGSLFAAMSPGASSRAEREEAPVDPDAVAMLTEALASEKAWVEFSHSEPSRNRLVDLAAATAGTPPVARLRAGSPEQLRVAHWARPLLTFVVGGSPQKLSVPGGGRPAEDLAALAVVKTKTDDKHGWLATGQLMARARLMARAAGLSTQTFGQAFQDRRRREELRTSIGHKGFVQAIVGFGSQAAQWAHRPLLTGKHEADANYRRRIGAG